MIFNTKNNIFKISFRTEIFLYFILVFIAFTFAILTFQYQREKKYRISKLENTLDNISEITHRFIEQNKLINVSDIDRIKEIENIIPQSNIRITIIAQNGNVLYDSFVGSYDLMENHLHRPEIQKAMQAGTGSFIRKSSTTQKEYYYYAKKYPNYFIRTAVVYNVEIKNFLKAERIYIFFIIAVFAVIGVILYFVTGKLSKSITRLEDFAIKAGRNELIEKDLSFPENELGIIGSQIIQIYNNLKQTKDELSIEREKLFNHLNALNEGIAFFSPGKKVTLSNSQFIQYVNSISKKSIHSLNDIFKNREYKKLNKFLNNHLKPNEPIEIDALPQTSYIIGVGEKYFKIQSIIFVDRSFEVVITDTTRLEKRRLLKQQLTSNIAHELKTPLASIKGYLETILDNWKIPEEKQKYFLERAFMQAERLTDLINDISLLNNIEDAGELFEIKPTDIKKVVRDVYENFSNRMEQKQIDFFENVKDGTIVNGNESLLFSIFQNLVENSIKYGGEGIKIMIDNYLQDEKYFYFSYSDTGPGIPEEHLPRIFERFYRVDHGRTREAGGTGLGLAIIKNAVQLHKGDISVKNRNKKGIEFIFSISKK